MVDPRLKVIANALRAYTGDCICDEAYTGRNLIDPHCQYHIVPNEEAAADIIAALDAMGQTTVGEGNQMWNVFLYDPQRQYGDYMVTVRATTKEDAESTALAENPGSTIAHPTELSVYSSSPENTNHHATTGGNSWGGIHRVIN